jgi:DNA repair exonuclease SbcCD ATPase subunit
LVRCEEDLDEFSSKLEEETSNLNDLQTRLNLIDESEMKEVLGIYNTHSSEYKDLEYRIKDFNLNIQHNQSKIDNLSNHEYDPDCKFCVNNVFVKDAKEAESILTDLIRERNILEFRLEEVRVIMASLEYVHDDVRMFDELERNILDKQRKIHQIEKDLSNNKTRCIELQTKAEKLESIIHNYIQNEGLIKENERITLEISQKESERNDYISTLRSIEKDLITSSGQLRVYEKEIQDYNDAISKLQGLETKYKAYDLYLKAVNRNGVPYELISEAIPKIQAEVNSILSQIVDFEILFEMDGKSINAYIAYDDENFWALEMTSGMEKFISSLAIRTALINVSSLPRPNFIAIDEGWGTLDSDNLNSLHMFFDYMKTQFDFLLTISHIDALRDIVDSVVEINKNKGVSQVQY